MTRRIIFNDLSPGPLPESGGVTRKDDLWLSQTAATVDANAFTFAIKGDAAHRRPAEVDPVLSRQPDGTWRAGRYIGEIRRGDTVLEIRPRLDFPTITSWASLALNLRIVPHAAGRGSVSFLIAELQAAAWRRAMLGAARHGVPGIRADQQHEGPSVRGRLDVARTIPLRVRRSPHVASINTPKIVDNPVTRAIVIADRILNRRLHRPGWRGDRLDELLSHLRGATGARPALPSRRELQAVRYTPITLAYRAAAELSWDIAKNRGPRGDTNDDKYDGLLLDVAELWELFLLHCLTTACDQTVTHGTTANVTKHLLHSTRDPSKVMGRLYPDFTVGDLTSPTAIIDAKYKRLTDPFPVAREDLYQLTSYLTAYANNTQPPRGMLAYPLLPDSAPSTAESNGPWSLQAKNVAQVDFMRLPTTEKECTARFAELLAETRY